MAEKETKAYIRRLECGVCSKTFTDPRILPCSKGVHTVCRDCLQKLVNESSITCPLCKMTHTVPEDGVDGFPPNLAVADMIDTLCKSCRRAEPDKHCSHCEQNVCISCKVSHMSFEDATQFLMDLRYTIQESEQKGKITDIQQANELYMKIDDAAAILVRKIEERVKKLKEEVRKRLEDNSAPMKRWKVEMDKHIATAKKYLDDTKSKLGDKYSDNTTDQELADIKTWCQKKITEMKSEIKQAPLVPKTILDYDSTEALSAIAKFGSIRPRYGKPRVVGQRGSKPGEFVNPWDVAVCPVTDHVVITDSNNHRVQVLDANMCHVMDITKDGQGQALKWPWGVAINSKGDIIITDYSAKAVHVYRQDGVYSHQIPGTWSSPRGVTVDGEDNVYICDSYTHSIKVTDSKGTIIRSFGSRGSGEGKFSSWPWYITIYKSHVYISDGGSRVYQFTTSGGYIGQLGQDIIGQATGLSVRGSQDLVVVDYNKGSIIIMRDDKLLCCVGERGDQPWQMKDPRGVAVTKTGQIIVANLGHNNMLVYDPLE